MGRKRTKIIFIIDHMRADGAQRVLSNIVNNLPPEDFDFSIINVRDETPLTSELKAAGHRITSLSLNRHDFRAPGALRSIISKARPDIAHTHLDFSNTFGARAALAGGVPIVIRHDHSGCTNQGSAYLRLRKLAEKLVGANTRVIAISNDVKKFNESLGVDSGKITVIHNGVDLDTFSAQTRSPHDPVAGTEQPATPVIGYVGRLIERKGLKTLVAAASTVLDKTPGAKFLIIGDGPLRGELEQDVAERGLKTAFKFLGHQESPEKYFALFDVAVVPSLFEPFGLTVIEAMSMSKPVVASAVGGIVEIIENGKTGLLVTPENSTLLAESISRLLSDPRLAAELGRSGRLHIEKHFSVQAQMMQIRNLYNELMGVGENAGS